MKRHLVRIEDLASWHNLVLATHKAARGKRHRPDVAAFCELLPENLSKLSASILEDRVPLGHYKRFVITDPKRRLIHAASFEDRVLHQAVLRAQRHLQRFSYFAKIDIESYFPSIEHTHLKQLMKTRFKGEAFLLLLDRIIDSSPDSHEAKGLPIGSLTSQYFANHYLCSADRLLANHPLVRAQVRYMDDMLWWGNSPSDLKVVLAQLQIHLSFLGLRIKPSSIQIQSCQLGVSYCGFRIKRGVILPSRRKLHRYRQHMQQWCEWAQGASLNPLCAQSLFDCRQGTLAHCTSDDFRRRFWSPFEGLLD